MALFKKWRLLLHFVKNLLVISLHNLFFFSSNDNRSAIWILNLLYNEFDVRQTSKEECLVNRIETM